MADFQPSSPTPYLIRAWHEWMQDNRFTPHLLVKVDKRVSVPQEHVKDGEIVLNVGLEATGSLNLGNEVISFQARFSGRVRDISFPVDCVLSIFARETGQGMGFDMYDAADDEAVFDASADAYRYHPTDADKQPKGLSLVEKNNPDTMPKKQTTPSNDNSKDGSAKKGKDGKSSNLRLID